MIGATGSFVSSLVPTLGVFGFSTNVLDLSRGHPAAKELLPLPFNWGVGIENTFIHRFKNGQRSLDEYELMQHYGQWREDLDRVASLGVKTLRWGIPWYRVEKVRGSFDWSWTDQVIEYMIDKLKIDPILDLIHYGTPDWLENSLLDPEYPQLAGQYAAQVVRRYGTRIKYYTPMNEPTVAGEFCFLKGVWPPYGTGERSYVQGMLAIARGIQTVSESIRKERDDAVLVAVEAMHGYSASRLALVGDVGLGLYKDLLAWDLSRGAVDKKHPLYTWLLANGAEEHTLAVLRDSAVEQNILGLNFYPWSLVDLGKQTDSLMPGTMLKDVIRQVYEYTGKPLIVTETSSAGTVDERLKWMRQTIDSVKVARAAAIPVIGYTWFPVFSMVDWEYQNNTKPLADNLIQLGLWDASITESGHYKRTETPLADAYRQYVRRGSP